MSLIQEQIVKGETALGVELGSTRIKLVLIDRTGKPLASSAYTWENQWLEGYWTYDLSSVWQGLQSGYRDLKTAVDETYGVKLETFGAIGISAMMHGYLVFDDHDRLLTPFRTWRNNTTGQAASLLTQVFQFAIPQRWSIAHLYQAILNHEDHVSQIAYMTTLAGYVHYALTGEKRIGIDDASGMFPIDYQTRDFNEKMLTQFDQVLNGQLPWKLKSILPQVNCAGQVGGYLTEKGARLLDPTGELKAGIPFCPPEGDAGTGMVATNSVSTGSGNVSAGTSAFAMIVLENKSHKLYPEIDWVTTPDGKPVGMAHSNNCSSDTDAWLQLFHQVVTCFKPNTPIGDLYEPLYQAALEGDSDCGNLLSIGYVSGEHLTGFDRGIPLFLRGPKSQLNLSNFMKAQLYSAIASLKIGLDLLIKQENIKLQEILGHGGFFKTQGVGQQILADALNTPVTVMETSGEGGAWGIALLANFIREDMTLEDYLNQKIFVEAKTFKLNPNESGVKDFSNYMQSYKQGLEVEAKALEMMKENH